MKLKSGVMFLGLMCVVLATPASAAKITIGDAGGFVDVGIVLQTWVRVEDNGNAHHDGPSFDIFFRRMRIYVNGAINEHIGVITNTDVSYTFDSVTNATGIVTNPTTAQDVIRFAAPEIILNEALGYWIACKEFTFYAGLQLLPWVHESLTDITRFAALDEQADATERGRPSSFFGRDRDMGLVITGDLAFINYRLGVFNGTQTALGNKNSTNALGGTPAPPVGAVPTVGQFGPYAGANPGDAPSFDGAIRINIVGTEPGYFYAGGLANNGKAYFSIGGGANIQPRGVIAPGRNSPTATYQGYFADLHLDIPFGDNEFVVEAGWIRTIYSGNGAPLNSESGTALINNAGNAFYGSVGIRFAWFYPYFAMEDYQSNLPSMSVAQNTFLPFGTGGVPAGLVGNLTTYHGGLKFLLGGPSGNQFMVNLDIAFQNKENAGNAFNAAGTEFYSANQWYGTVEFQWKI
jgi:hypothetical protein